MAILGRYEAPNEKEPALEYNSANYRAQWQTLQRVVKGPRAVKFPQLTRLFTGSKAEQKEAVKLFVESGNLADAEATFTATQRYREKTRKNRALLTIKQMREKGFSESLAFVLQAFLIGCNLFLFPLVFLSVQFQFAEDENPWLREPGRHC